MAIQNRRGSYNNFNPQKAVPGEFLVVQSGDPNTTDGKAVYVTFASGDVKMLAAKSDVGSMINEFAEDIAQQLEDTVKPYAERAEEAAQSLEVDDTLTKSGQPADAKKTGDEIGELKADIAEIEPGLSAKAKAALLACFAKVAWIDNNGQNYYDLLEEALYSQQGKTLLSINAVFTQGGNTIYDNDSLDTLNQYLTVTANYDNGTSRTVYDYILSGNLIAGVSTITVSYEGKTATFTVNVTHWDAVLQSITAVFTQGDHVYYPNDSLDLLKTRLNVTANYSNGTTINVPSTDYTLSGTLNSAQSTITVSYSGKTTSFTVDVTTFTWVYKGLDGVVLSSRSDILSATLANTYTESILNDLYHLIGTRAASKNAIFNLNQSTNTNAILATRIKFSSMSGYDIGTGFRLQLSNGTSGIQAFVTNNHVLTYAGTSQVNVPDSSINYDQWYTLMVKLQDNTGKIYLDGNLIYETNQLSTNYATSNRVLAQTTIVATNPDAANDLVLDIDWIGYKNND